MTPMIIWKTGNLKTREGWEGSLDDYLALGDQVDEDMAMYFLEVLPPAFFSSMLVQIGEPADHRGAGDRPRYDTVQRSGGLWYYTGPHVVAERCRIVRRLAVGERVHSAVNLALRNGTVVDASYGDDPRVMVAWDPADVEPSSHRMEAVMAGECAQ